VTCRSQIIGSLSLCLGWNHKLDVDDSILQVQGPSSIWAVTSWPWFLSSQQITLLNDRGSCVCVWTILPESLLLGVERTTFQS